MSSIADLRRDYALASLDTGDVVADPIAQFRQWFDNAIAAQITEPNAMTLATIGDDGAPVAAALGWISRRAAADRVLAGSAESSARSAAVPAAGCGVGARAAVALSG